MKLNMKSLRVIAFCWLSLFLGVSESVSQEVTVEDLVRKHVLPALKATGDERYVDLEVPKPANAAEAKKRLDAAAWNLMLGEVLSDNRGDWKLWTGAVDSLEEGLDSLEALEKADAKTKDDMRRAQHALAMKYDIVIARREEFQKRLNLSRDQEWKRLNQLRKLSVAYRDLVNGMAMADFYRQVGDLELAKTKLSMVVSAAESVTQIVESQKDFYLFEDEVRGNRSEPEEKYDFKMLPEPPHPLQVDFISHIRSLHAMALYRLATTNSNLLAEDVMLADRKALLTKARDLAQKVTRKDGVGDSNPIAHLARGWSELALGLLETHVAPHEDNRDANRHFAAAKESLRAARRELLERQGRGPTINTLVGRVQTALDRLESADWFLTNARQETVDGRPDNAHQILRQAALVHRSKEIWFAMLEAGLRAGIDPSELQSAFQNARASGLMTEGDEEVALLSAHLIGAKVWDRVSRVGLSGIRTKPGPGEAKSELARLRIELEEGNRLIKSSLASRTKLPPGSVRRAQHQAMGVYLLHLSLMLGLEENRPFVGSTENQEFVRYIQDARRVLHTNITASDDAWQTLGLRESRIQLYLATGYIASRFLEKYNDDAMIAYMAAYDDISALPYPVKYLKALGTPLLKGIDAVQGRSSDDHQKLAAVERIRRQQMTRFVEGMYVVHFGSPAEGAKHMQLGLRGAGGERDSINAREMFLQLNGFTDNVDHETAIRAFAALAHAEAGNSDAAIKGAMLLLDVPHDPSVQMSTRLDIASRSIASPLAGFALAQALHTKIQQFDIADSPNQRNDWIRRIRLIHDKVVSLGADSPYYKTRYPHLLKTNARQAARYLDASLFVKEAVKADMLGNLDAVVERTEAGLKHHPKDLRLWAMCLAARVERLRRGNASNDHDRTLAILERAVQEDLIPQHLGLYYQAVLLEALHLPQLAVDAYQKAAKATRDAQNGVVGEQAHTLLAQRIRAESKVVELNFHRR